MATLRRIMLRPPGPLSRSMHDQDRIPVRSGRFLRDSVVALFRTRVAPHYPLRVDRGSSGREVQIVIFGHFCVVVID